jgi:hypothetical protein
MIKLVGIWDCVMYELIPEALMKLELLVELRGSQLACNSVISASAARTNGTTEMAARWVPGKQLR